MSFSIKRLSIVGALVLFLISMCPIGCSNAESNEKTETDIADVKKEAGETAEAMKEYAGQQKQKIFNEAEAALKKMDDRIQSFKQNLDKKWAEMDRQARQQAQKTMDTLKEKREALAEKLTDLKESSAETWEKMKKEFWDSYESLKESLDGSKQEVKYI